MKTKLIYPVVCALIIALSSCSSKMTTRSSHKAFRVSIAININMDKSSITDVDTSLYKLKIKDYLDNFGQADLVFAESNAAADVILDIAVKNFQVLPKKEYSSAKTTKQTVQVGTDAKGNPIYQTFTTTVYSESIAIPSKARFSSRLIFKDPSFGVAPQNYFAQQTWRDGGRLISGNMGPYRINTSSGRLPNGEPFVEDFLFQLSQEMLSRASYDLRKYYQKLDRERDAQTYLSAN